MYASTALVLAAALPALAFEKITIPSTVKANTEVEVKITNDLGNGANSFDAAYANFNIYLATSPPSASGLMPTCLLSKGNKIDTTSVKVNIPADLFPSDATFAVATLELKANKDKNSGSSGYKYSDQFSLEGSTGSWGKAEQGGLSFMDGDTVPCSSYGCARKCDDKYYDDLKKFQQSQDMSAYKSLYQSAYDCITKCPGASMRSPDSIANGSSSAVSSTASSTGNSSNSSSVATKTGSASATSTGSASAASTDSASATSTDSASATSTDSASATTTDNASATSGASNSLTSSYTMSNSSLSGFVTSTGGFTPTSSRLSGANGDVSSTQGSVSASVTPSGASRVGVTQLVAVFTALFAASQLIH